MAWVLSVLYVVHWDAPQKSKPRRNMFSKVSHYHAGGHRAWRRYLLMGGVALGLGLLMFPLRRHLLQAGMASARGHTALTVSDTALWQGIALKLYNNDSIADYQVNGHLYSAAALDTLWEADYEVAISANDDWACIQVLFDSLLYIERWDTLPQLQFWRQIMTLPKDTCLVSRSGNRAVLDRLPTWTWERMEESEQRSYRDSLRKLHGLAQEEVVYITAGKNHYYQFDRVLPTIGRAIDIFQEEGVDPWYAQAILLIESPGALHRSPVGAYGSFQLMAEVAREQGLVVSDSVDEREDFVKSAAAAARHIQRRGVRPVRNYLKSFELEFTETDLWFRLLVLHAYHAGPGNVAAVLQKIQPEQGGIPLMQQVWRTEAAGFKNASQNYSQLALASMVQVDHLMPQLPDSICQEAPILYLAQDPDSALAPSPTLAKAVSTR